MNNTTKLIICGFILLAVAIPNLGLMEDNTELQKAGMVISVFSLILLGFYAGRAWDEQE